MFHPDVYHKVFRCSGGFNKNVTACGRLHGGARGLQVHSDSREELSCSVVHNFLIGNM